MIKEISTIQEQIRTVALSCGRDPSTITLCAATKMQSDDTIRQAIKNGIMVCGENRVQELMAHLETNVYQGAEVHFIGHLQTNKVKQVVGNVSLIHSVGSEKLVDAIEKEAEKQGICQDILIEVNIAGEESKSGIPPQQLNALVDKIGELTHVRLRGLMAIPPICRYPEDNKSSFSTMYQLFVDIQQNITHNCNEINCLSMGMSGDFECAIREGATLVRVGTALFGQRPQSYIKYNE